MSPLETGEIKISNMFEHWSKSTSSPTLRPSALRFRFRARIFAEIERNINRDLNMGFPSNSIISERFLKIFILCLKLENQNRVTVALQLKRSETFLPLR